MPTRSNNTGGRGGKRPGAGRKKKATIEKATNGNPGGRALEVLDIPEVEGADMPDPHDFLSAEQKDGSRLQAKEIYEDTWNWLKSIGCASIVSPQMIAPGLTWVNASIKTSCSTIAPLLMIAKDSTWALAFITAFFPTYAPSAISSPIRLAMFSHFKKML